jgi:SAM-dependent methyltransferase
MAVQDRPPLRGVPCGEHVVDLREFHARLLRTEDHRDPIIAVLDVVDDLPGASEIRERINQLLASAPADCVVDVVGCGTGRAVGEMHQRGVRAVGVDIDETMLAVARVRWPASPFQPADAYDLPLADGEAQGYRADKLYHAIDDPGRALLEARRVLARGGRIVLAGQDWDTLVIDSDQPELTRKVGRRADGASPQRQIPPRGPAVRGDRDALLTRSRATAREACAHVEGRTASSITCDRAVVALEQSAPSVRASDRRRRARRSVRRRQQRQRVHPPRSR